MFCLAKDIFLWTTALQLQRLEGDVQHVPPLEEEVTKSALRPSLPPQQDVALPELQQSHSALGGQQAPMHTGSLEDFVLRKSLQELESPVGAQCCGAEVVEAQLSRNRLRDFLQVAKNKLRPKTV